MNEKNWNAIITALPSPHLLQSWQWGQVKSKFGWTPSYQTWQNEKGVVVAAAQILQRSIRLPAMTANLRMLYIPKGPLLRDWHDAQQRQRVLTDLKALARNRRALFIKIDPDVPLGTGMPGEQEALESEIGQALVAELGSAGWQFSNEQVQYRNTVVIDLTLEENQLLANMKQKSRYNVRLAGRKGVSVRVGTPDDFDMLFRMYMETAERDNFTLRTREYYLAVWRTFFDAGFLRPLIAEVEAEPVAGLFLFMYGQKAWYIYGMSRAIHRAKMPTALLQWEAIRAAKAAGCTRYDLWGAPDTFNEQDSLWGVFRFKQGLGGQVVRHIGAWDLSAQPWIYSLYTRAIPRLLSLMRLRAKSQARHPTSDL